jgi:RimJ/RimL family protein N-acetyltransferase
MGEHVAGIEVGATPSAPALLLRRWRLSDAADLVTLYRDGALRRWATSAVDDGAGAARWVRVQQRAWEAGDRFAFAVVEPRTRGDEGQLLGHVVLKDVALGTGSAGVGYWTAAHARGRGVAPRALQALTDWAFDSFTSTAGEGLTRLELLHQADNLASCRVAQKCRYEPTRLLPAAPPAYPLDGHLHVRERSSWQTTR